MERARHYQTATRDKLTPRQREVLDLIARGKTNGEIAERLGITLDGAKFHVREILAKLGVESREEAAAWWRKESSAVKHLPSWLRAMNTGPVIKAALGLSAAGVGIAILGGAVVWRMTSNVNASMPPRCAVESIHWSSTATPLANGMRFELRAASATECRFEEAMTFDLASGNGTASVDGSRSLSPRLGLGPAPSVVMAVVSSNVCVAGPLMAQVVLPGSAIYVLEAGDPPPCANEDAPATLSVVHSP